MGIEKVRSEWGKGEKERRKGKLEFLRDGGVVLRSLGGVRELLPALALGAFTGRQAPSEAE